MTVSDLPTLNASLNLIASVCLFLGWRAIRRGDKEVHRCWMISALLASAFFLSSYLIYHFQTEAVRSYPGTGWDRGVYYFILATHVPLATIMVPFILRMVFFAMTQQFARHKKLAKWVWPVWMYVSVTGVLIYVMLYLLPLERT